MQMLKTFKTTGWCLKIQKLLFWDMTPHNIVDRFL